MLAINIIFISIIFDAAHKEQCLFFIPPLTEITPASMLFIRWRYFIYYVWFKFNLQQVFLIK